MNSWAQTNGVDPERVTVVNDTRIENVADAVADLALYFRSQLIHNEPILLVIDSVAAMDCADNIDSKMTDAKAEMGGRAKALYKYFRIRSELFYRLGVTQIYINQLRTALNVGFGKDNTTTTGGAALKFYASIRAAFYSGRSITVKQKGKERKAGKLVTVRLIKNKVAPPRPTISKCPVYFNPKFHEVGFDRCFGLEDVLVENDIIIKSSGGVYKLKDKTLARGEEKFQKLLEEDDDLRTMPMPRRKRRRLLPERVLTLMPFTIRVPEVMRCIRLTERSRVDLPAPERPMMATNSPSWMVRFTSSSPTVPLGYTLDTWSN